MKRLLPPLLCGLVLGLASCPLSEKKPASDASPSAPPQDRVERTDPLWNSYLADIAASPLRLIRLAEGDFSSLEWHTASKGAGGVAYIGLRRYSLENGRTLILSSSQGGDPHFEPADLTYGLPSARWVSEYSICAGPAAFSDALLVGTAEPSLVFLDPLSLSPLSVLPLEHLPLGRIEYDAEENLLRIAHGDGSVGYYGAPAGGLETSDPVASLIGPEPPYRRAMDEVLLQKLPSRLGDTLSSLAVDPYGPRVHLSSDGIALFRYDAESDGPLRLYLDGAVGRPYLIMVFDAQGTAAASNVEYAAAAVLEFHPSAGEVYYVAAAFLDELGGPDPLSEERPARLVVAEKNP